MKEARSNAYIKFNLSELSRIFVLVCKNLPFLQKPLVTWLGWKYNTLSLRCQFYNENWEILINDLLVDMLSYGDEKFNDKNKRDILICTIRFFNDSQRFSESRRFLISLPLSGTPLAYCLSSLHFLIKDFSQIWFLQFLIFIFKLLYVLSTWSTIIQEIFEKKSGFHVK